MTVNDVIGQEDVLGVFKLFAGWCVLVCSEVANYIYSLKGNGN